MLTHLYKNNRGIGGVLLRSGNFSGFSFTKFGQAGAPEAFSSANCGVIRGFNTREVSDEICNQSLGIGTRPWCWASLTAARREKAQLDAGLIREIELESKV